MSMAIPRIDPPSEAAQQALCARLCHDCQALGQSSLHALFDPSCADSALLQPLAELAGEVRHLYQGFYAGEGLERVDPWLMEIPLEQADKLLALCRLCSGQPALGFIVTTTPGTALLQHLRQQLEARDPEGTLYILRWADTRCLPMLHACFDEPQRIRLLKHIQTWMYFDRDGEPRQITPPGAPASPGKEPKAPYQLSAEQTHALHQAMRPDAALALIADRPHLYGRLAGLPSQQHLAARLALAHLEPAAATVEALRAVSSNLEARGLLQQ
jgi:hypothetical protein